MIAFVTFTWPRN